MNSEILYLNEHTSSKYVPRTYYNATSADITLALATDLNTAGEVLTKRAAGEKYIGFQLNDDIDDVTIARELYKKFKKNNAKTLNIAGNGIYTLVKYNCSQEFINLFVYNIVSKVNQYLPISRIYTGGQTGVDLAGAVAGYVLEIPTEVTLPKGYLQRGIDNKDFLSSKEQLFKDIHGLSLQLIENLEKEKVNTNSTKIKP